MLQFFVFGLLLCKASSYIVRNVETATALPEFYDDLTSTEDYNIGSSTTEYRKQLRVDDGYKEISGLGSYKVYHSEKTWNEANDICRDEGGNLIVIRTIFEAIKVGEMLDQQSPRNRLSTFWLGLHQVMDREQHLRWKTSLDEDLPHDFALPNGSGNGTFSRLVFGPLNINNDQCGLLLTSLHAKVSAPCKYPTSFICKREPIN